MLDRIKRLIKKIFIFEFFGQYKSIKYNKKRLKFYNLGRYSYSMSPELIKPDTIIGDFVSIDKNVQIGPGNHPTNFLSSSPFTYHFRDINDRNKRIQDKTNHLANKKPITIGNDVWIGTNVVVMNGINIGTGAIIGANAVVTHDVDPYEIVGGVPAKTIRYRFERETIYKILNSRWWRFPDEILLDLPLDNINKTLKILTERTKNIRNTIKLCFIVTSCIYPYQKSLNYSDIRSVFSESERLEQTKKTISSIRKKCHQAYIVLIDNGRSDPGKEIGYLVDKFKYIGGKKSIQFISSNKNKSIGEAYMLLKATKIIIQEFDLIFKISGRYYLTDDFDIAEYDTKAFNFLNYYEKKIITGNGSYNYGFHSTRLYSFPGYKLKTYRKALWKTMIHCFRGESIEMALPKTLKREKFFYHQSLGLAGEVAINGTIINE